MSVSPEKRALSAFVPAALMAILLIGCGRSEQPASAASAPAAATEASQGERASAPLKLAFVYLGPVGSGGWTYAHDQARKTVEAEFGDRIDATVVENVPEGEAAEKAFRALARDGNRVIFGTSVGYRDAMLKVAKEYPDVRFEHVAGDRTTANLSTYEARTYEGAYLAGLLAGKASKSGKLGFVASVPIPEVFRNINAFTLGAQAVNPAATTRVAWVQAWFDPVKERESALKLIEEGADVLMQNSDSPEVLKAAQEKGALAFGWDSDMTQYGPKAHLGSAVIDWAPYYKSVVQAISNGTWKSGTSWLGVRQNVIRIASPNPGLPQDVILFLGEKTHALKAGTLHPFDGPVTDRDGREVIAPGTTLDDAGLRRMNYLVHGVKGEIPG